MTINYFHHDLAHRHSLFSMSESHITIQNNSVPNDVALRIFCKKIITLNLQMCINS